MDTKQLIHTLNNYLTYYNDLYYSGNEAVTDRTYDLLLETLTTLEKEFPCYKPENSMSAVIGIVDKNNKHKHTTPMLSLKKAYTKEDINKFCKSVSKRLGTSEVWYRINFKYDGIAISGIYTNNELSYILTRGDGIQGIKLPQRFNTLLPKYYHKDELRGELCVLKSNLSPEYKTTRSEAVGIVMGNGDISKLVFYEHFEQHSNTIAFHSKLDKLINKLVSEIDKQKVSCDGLVVFVAGKERRETLGHNGKTPRYAIAYKPTNKTANTKLVDIVYQTGKKGKITPVAILDPVVINGTTITKASLHNDNIISKLGIKVGDTVEVALAGSVIPKIMRVVNDRMV
jgi:DNA ligase (NAD+)